MAVLEQRRRPTIATMLGALLLVTASGCVLIESLGLWTPERSFNHGIHTSIGMDCSDCHEPDRWKEPTQPTLELCQMCHEEGPEAVEAAALFAEGGPLSAGEVEGFSSEVIFSHGRHEEAGVACADCHMGVEESEKINGSLRLDMADCTRCHSDFEHGGGNECSVCHTQLDVDVAPGTHERQWTRLHGQTVRAGVMATADDCSMCHTRETCVTCHLEEPPANHNNIFRLRTHGSLAAMDRDNCMVCHRSDSCVRCHEEVLPLSHRGMWGNPKNTHCFSCHFPLQQTTCFVCHKSTPSHQAATPLPPNHSPASDCRACHGMDAPLPHVDNGDDCTICHK